MVKATTRTVLAYRYRGLGVFLTTLISCFKIGTVEFYES